MKFVLPLVALVSICVVAATVSHGQVDDEGALPTDSTTKPENASGKKPGARAGAGRKQQANAAAAGRPKPKAPKASTAPTDRLYGTRITETEGYNNQPTIAQTEDATIHTVWVMYVEKQGDSIVTRQMNTPNAPQASMGPIKILSARQGQYMRPVIAASKDQVLCLWTETMESDRAQIWFSKFVDGKWSAAARLLPDEKMAHQNPEVVATEDGTFAVAYQIHNGHTYDIHLQTLKGDTWSKPKVLSDKAGNDWDPTLAFDTKGNLHVAWACYSEGDYDVLVTRLADNGAGEASKPKRISARGEYDMHPWLAPSPDGSVWVSWDVVRLKNHGYSGGTTITGANRQRDLKDTNEGQANHWSGIEVRVLDGDTVRIPGNPREEIIAPQGYVIAHRGLGKIAVSPNGEPWIIYRALMKPIAPWGSNVRDGYLWELLARPFADGKWQDARVFDSSDGYLEEPGVVVGKGGVRIAFAGEHRHSQARRVSYVTKKDDAPAVDPNSGAGPQNPAATTQQIDKAYDHHHDFDGLLGWHGDVYLAPLQKMLPEELKLASLPIEKAPVDRDVDPRETRQTGTYEATVGGKTLKLLWGDLHRHSNVSRCSVGNEPNPEDLYRYGLDVDMYDFFGLSDHCEYTTDYYWWRQQKVADLFHIPGVFSVMYNAEWSMGFPQGHTNTIFPTRHNYKMNPKQGATHTLVGGWEFLDRGGFKAITIPHTPADPGMGTTWPAYNPKYERLCEIFQACRGSYEYENCPRQHVNATNKQGFYWKALEKGYKLGIICSSDHGYGCAYACVYAPENTRDAVWQGLWDRRTYGSTTYGLVMEAHCGDHWMGEEFSSATAPTIEAYVRGSTKLRSVEVMGRFKTLFSVGSVEKPIGDREYRLKWTDEEWSKLKGEQWYYVRVTQEDDEMAWSSPMWISHGTDSTARAATN